MSTALPAYYQYITSVLLTEHDASFAVDVYENTDPTDLDKVLMWRLIQRVPPVLRNPSVSYYTKSHQFVCSVHGPHEVGNPWVCEHVMAIHVATGDRLQSW